MCTLRNITNTLIIIINKQNPTLSLCIVFMENNSLKPSCSNGDASKVIMCKYCLIVHKLSTFPSSTDISEIRYTHACTRLTKQ